MAISQIQQASLASGVPSSIASSALPAGTVLQVVNVNYGSYVTTTSTSLIATGVSASITPKSATSKILVLVSMNGLFNVTSSNAIHFELFRNGVSQTYLEDIFGYSNGINAGTSYQYFDSPATTSSTTYAMYWKSITGATIQLNNYYTGAGRTVSGITLMEIAQ